MQLNGEHCAFCNSLLFFSHNELGNAMENMFVAQDGRIHQKNNRVLNLIKCDTKNLMEILITREFKHSDRPKNAIKSKSLLQLF